MKNTAILIALLLFQACLSLPVSDSSEEDISDISSESDDTSETDETIELKEEQKLLPGGKFMKEYVVGGNRGIDFDGKKGEPVIDSKKPASVNKNSSDDSNDSDDSDIDDEEENLKNDEVKKEPVESFKRVKSASDAKPYIRKANRDGPKQVIPFKKVQKVPEESSSEEDLKTVMKPEVKVPAQSFKRAKPASEAKPYIRKANRDGPKQVKKVQKVSEKSSSEEDLKTIIKPEVKVPAQTFKLAKPASEAQPYIRKANRDGVKEVIPFRRPQPKEKTPEEFEKRIEELKKEIQRMKVLGQSESDENDEDSSSDKFVGEIVEKIKNLKDEIKVERGIETEASEEVGKSSSEEIDYEESSSEEEEESNEENDENSSEEQDPIKNIKLVQTFDGENEPSSDSSEPEAKNEDSKEISGLVKLIQDLKTGIKEQRKLEMDADSEESVSDEKNSNESDESEESVDEKLLSTFQELEKNEELQDIKKINVVKDENQKPMLDIEKPENLESDEVKIGFVISNEQEDSEEDRVVDLLNFNAPQRVANIEIIPVDVISFGIIPVETPRDDFVELIEIVDMPEKEILENNEVMNVIKKAEETKKNAPHQPITGGILSKVGDIFNFVKKQFY